MIDLVREGIQEVQNLPEGDKGPLETWIYGWVVVNVVYYIVLGLVVVVLGFRLITAMAAAIRESKRVADQDAGQPMGV